MQDVERDEKYEVYGGGGVAVVVGVVGPVAVLTNVPRDVKSVATTLSLGRTQD